MGLAMRLLHRKSLPGSVQGEKQKFQAPTAAAFQTGKILISILFSIHIHLLNNHLLQFTGDIHCSCQDALLLPSQSSLRPPLPPLHHRLHYLTTMTQLSLSLFAHLLKAI